MRWLWEIRTFFLSFFKRKTMGARALIVREGQILLVNHTYMPGWHSVGGGVESGETLVEAVERELREEAGVICTYPPALFGVYYNPKGRQDDYVALYIVTHFDIPEQDAWKKSTEIAEIRWFDLDNLPAETSPATARRVTEYLGLRRMEGRW